MKNVTLPLLLLFFSLPTTGQQSGQPSGANSSDCHGYKNPSGDCVVAPQTIYAPQPHFPADAGSREGTVSLRLLVDTEGVPQDITVFHSLTPSFDAEAVDAVKKWKFSPSTKNGKPTAVQIVVQVDFHRAGRRR